MGWGGGLDWKYDGSHICPRRRGPLPSQPLTLINGRAGSSQEHLVNRLHSESMEGGPGVGGALRRAECTARPFCLGAGKQEVWGLGRFY